MRNVQIFAFISVVLIAGAGISPAFINEQTIYIPMTLACLGALLGIIVVAIDGIEIKF